MTLTPEASKTVEPLTQEQAIASLGKYGYGWADSDVAGASAQRGLSEAVVRDISAKKSEPEWMLQTRLKALRIFDKKPMPNWGSNLDGIHFDNIKYFVRSSEKQAATWDCACCWNPDRSRPSRSATGWAWRPPACGATSTR